MNNKNKDIDFSEKPIRFLLILPFKSFSMILTMFSKLHKHFVKRLRFSITFKITTVYAFIFFRILLLLSIVIGGTFIVYSGKAAEDSLLKDFNLTSYYMNNSTEFPKNNIEELSKVSDVNISIFDENRKIIFTTDISPSSKVFYEKADKNNIWNVNGDYLLLSNKVQSPTNTPTNNIALILNKSLHWNSNNIYIQVTSKLTKECTSAILLMILLLSINVVFILLTIFSGSRASRKMLKPIDNMTKTVKNITINALDTRLDISGSQDELKELAETFNTMLDRIQQAYAEQNQFVSDSSHELRTPISVIQGYANLLDRWGKNDKDVLDESIEAIKTEAENMKKLIENLLFLARGDKNTQKVELTLFNINDLIDEVVHETKLIDDSHEINSDKASELMINADRTLLKQAVRVFMDNSIKYTPRGGVIKINSFKRGPQALITIEDTGIGIPKEDLPKVFNRFYRTDKSRTKETGGTGLGLSIAKWIILKHKGSIEIESKPNTGTKITLILPIGP
jgi:two-component system, OmpR family, sensor histidine kinase ArlS